MNREQPAGSTLSHYRIVSQIGARGMGEVYLAQDTKLDRKVAVKFLHEDFSRTPISWAVLPGSQGSFGTDFN